MTSNENPRRKRQEPYAPATSRRRISALTSLTALITATVGGCGSPPSVAPLMQVTDKALAQESKHLETMRKREKELLKERRQGLKTGFEADLKQRDDLTAKWVQSHATGYAAAREALLKQHLKRTRQYEQRLENLQAARRALERTTRMLQRQDELLTKTLGGDLWDLRGLLESDS